jgi:sulfate permease, SulP family
LIKNKSIDWFPARNWIGDVNAKTLRSDLLAGLTGAIIVLPQGVAFAMIAGLPPIYGLYTAMVLPIVAALFGSSRHLISGPTTPISLVVFAAISEFAQPATPDFISLAIVVTLVAGVIQLLLGLARLGVVVNFVSHSVIIGFTAGAALLIATSQLNHLLGIEIPRGTNFIDTWILLFKNPGQINLTILGIGSGALVLSLLIKRIHPMAPHLLTAMIITSFITYYFFGDDAKILLVGKLPQGLPPFKWPEINPWEIKLLVPNAFAIALLGLIEAVAIGRSIALKTGQRINSNQEFIGQGMSNIVGSFFSSYAGSGSFTRSGINHSAGAKTPMAAIFAALFLMLAISFVAPWAAYLPISVMAGVIILVAYNLIDFKHIKKLLLTSGREASVMIITFLATLFLELDYAIYLGVFFSLVLYLRQTATPRFVQLAPDPGLRKRMFRNVDKYNLESCPQLMIYRMEGSLFFGAIEHVADQLEELFNRKERNLLLVANNINLIDNSGAEFLVNEVEKWSKKGKKIYFSGLKLRGREFLEKGGYMEEIGKTQFFGNKAEAVGEIYKKLDSSICRDCPVQLFKECPSWKSPI